MGCSFCGNEKLYAKGLCRNCYIRKLRKGTLEYSKGQKYDVYSREGKYLFTDYAKNINKNLGIPLCTMQNSARTHYCTKYELRFIYAGETFQIGHKNYAKIYFKYIWRIDLKTGEKVKFESIYDAINSVGGTRQGLHQAVNKPTRTYKGYKWEAITFKEAREKWY